MNIEQVVKDMTNEEHIKLLKLVVENRIQYTENRNGVFVNYSRLPEEHQKIIKEFIANTLSIENN